MILGSYLLNYAIRFHPVPSSPTIWWYLKRQWRGWTANLTLLFEPLIRVLFCVLSNYVQYIKRNTSNERSDSKFLYRDMRVLAREKMTMRRLNMEINGVFNIKNRNDWILREWKFYIVLACVQAGCKLCQRWHKINARGNIKATKFTHNILANLQML